jgi:hypothetical protein
MTVDTPLSANIILTSAQRAALDADRADGSDRVALVAVHTGELNLNALTQALMELRRRHDVLRTTVHYTDDGPVGTVGIRTVVPVELMAGRPRRPADGFPPKRLDPARGPLVHVALSSDDDGRTFLGFQAHAAALDEETMRRAVHELGLLYRYFANGGPMPAVPRGGYWENVAGVRSAAGRVPRRMPVVSHEIGPVIADRLRLIASSRGLPVALLVLAAWIAAGAASGVAPVSVAASLPDRSGRRPLGPACDRILLRVEAGSACDLVALAEHLHTAGGNPEPDDGGTPVTFTFDDGRTGPGAGPFEVVESGTMLAPSAVSLAAYGTPAAGWLLRLAHREDIAGARATLARTAALLEEAGASLVEEELL